MDKLPIALSKLPSFSELPLYSKIEFEKYGLLKLMEPLKSPKWQKKYLPFFRFTGSIISRVFNEKAWRNFIDGNWNDFIDLCQEQLVRNHQVIQSLEESSKVMKRFNYSRKFNQLPCSAATVERRLSLIRKHCPKEYPVLLLGDDDLLSLRLLEDGFSDITVLEIDPRIISIIKKGGKTIRAVEMDLRKPPSKELKRAYQMVIMDPPCTEEGLDVFLTAAMNLLDNNFSRFLLCTHLFSQKESGMAYLNRFIERANLTVTSIFLGFNVYPLPTALRLGLGVISCLFGGTSFSPKFFVSDLIILETNASATHKCSSTKILN